MNRHGQIVAELASLVAVAGTLAKALPALAALMAVIWYAVNLWECKTAIAIRARFSRERAIAVRVVSIIADDAKSAEARVAEAQHMLRPADAAERTVLWLFLGFGAGGAVMVYLAWKALAS